MEAVLVVEHDERERDRIGGWLEDAGFDVIGCPGPEHPDYTCLGSSGGPCPLAKTADIVVLDMHLASEDALRGTPSWQLLVYYAELGKKIVVLTAADDAVHTFTDEQVRTVRRPPTLTALLEAVGSFRPRKVKI